MIASSGLNKKVNVNVEDKDFPAHLPCVVVLVVELSEGLVAYAIGVVEAAKRKSVFIF